MQEKGLKEVKKGVKLFKQKQKIDAKIKQLAKQYHEQVGFKTEDEKYYLALVESYIKEHQNSK
ncbi:MAG: hypothetical protein IJ358_03245 [Clostridia bacterium]|nr:hypothetical protein [Clostridia bacterium]